MSDDRGLGLVLGSTVAPEQLPGAAATAEECGFDELWLAEDFFFTGGISGAVLALEATNQIKVGLGVVSAVVRHPALLAMEISTISRVHPGRLTAGIGLGVPGWVRQMSLYPSTTLGALRDSVTGLRSLLRGDELTHKGSVHSFDRVQLAYPEASPTPVHMGVIGPKMLQLSGEIADGSIFSVAASLEYVRWARDRIEEGRQRGHRTDAHRITMFALYSVDTDGAAAREAVRGPLAFYKSNGPNSLTDVHGISDQLQEIIDRGGAEALEREMPGRWIEELTVAGSPAECAAKINQFYEAGVDTVALFPTPTDRVSELVELTSAEVIPLL
ncbi:MAG: LLM class flavin-dependent oxidoreductase [Acidimicrobiia bacterium]|nr:LLM class flavin-dependent oxidoreductase [Acidimicrobiia bacterium]